MCSCSRQTVSLARHKDRKQGETASWAVTRDKRVWLAAPLQPAISLWRHITAAELHIQHADIRVASTVNCSFTSLQLNRRHTTPPVGRLTTRHVPKRTTQAFLYIGANSYMYVAQATLLIVAHLRPTEAACSQI